MIASKHKSKQKKDNYLASVGLYVTSYFSIGNATSVGCCQLTRTEFGLINVTVMFSGAAGIDPAKKLYFISNKSMKRKQHVAVG